MVIEEIIESIPSAVLFCHLLLFLDLWIVIDSKIHIYLKSSLKEFI